MLCIHVCGWAVAWSVWPGGGLEVLFVVPAAADDVGVVSFFPLLFSELVGCVDRVTERKNIQVSVQFLIAVRPQRRPASAAIWALTASACALEPAYVIAASANAA